jgi:release factor glutamine methyltransferase
MTISQALKLYPTIESDLLLAHIVNRPKEFLYINPSYRLTSYELRVYKQRAERRLEHEPIAYILGYKDFYGLRFSVNRHVLIPRPETEWLVDQALVLLKARSSKLKAILDLGTGSGCIAISIAKHCPLKGVKIYASDISTKALTTAKANAQTHKAKVRYIQSDLFKNSNQKFDLIIANLPYVPLSDYQKLHAHLKHEPKNAITDGTSTWKLYELFFQQVANHVNPQATILLEIDPKARHRLATLAKKYLGGWSITFQQDLKKHWRYARIQKPL